MKTLLIALFALILSVSNIHAADTYSGIYEPAVDNGEPLNSLGTQQELAASIASKIEQKTKAIADEQHEDFKYFEEFKNDTNCLVSSIVCPDLTPRFAETHVSILDNFNLRSGVMMCSVHNIDTLSRNENKPIYKKNFIVKSCVQELGELKNNQIDDPIQGMINTAADRDAELKELKLSYLQDFQQTGTEKFLDLGDWLDALATVDAEKINIEASLNQGQIQTTTGFTTVPNATVLEKFEQAAKSLFLSRAELGDYSALSSSEIDALLIQNNMLDQRNKELADSKYLGYLGFFTKSNEYLMQVLNMLLIFAILHNVFGWIFKSASAKASGYKMQENHVHRGVFGTLVLVIFFAGTSSQLNVQTPTSSGEDPISTTIKIENTRAQDFVRIVYGFANEISDNLAKIGIEEFLNSSALDSGVFDEKTIRALNTEKNILLKENEMLKMLEFQTCQNQFDITLLQNDLQNYRQEVLKQKSPDLKFTEKVIDPSLSKDVLDFYDRYNVQNSDHISYRTHDQSGLFTKINPYPKSDREAFAMSAHSLNTAYSGTGGYLKNELTSGQNYHSFQSCNAILMKILNNNSGINKIEKKLDFSGDSSLHEYRIEKLKSTHEIMHKNFAELGYLSMIYLPATSFINGKDEDFQNSKLMSFDEESETDYLQEVAKAAPLFLLFNGKAIADTLHDLLPTSWFPGLSAAVRPLSYYLTIEFIEHALEVIVILTLICSAIISFILLTLHKLWGFFALAFLPIWAFHENQESKIMDALSRILIVAFKTILLVVTLFLAIWSMSLAQNMEDILLGTFFNNMQAGVASVGVMEDAPWWVSSANIVERYVTNFAQNIRNYAILGLSTLVFTILKIYLIITIIFKLPNYFFSLLGIDAEDLGDKMQEQLQEVARRESMRGI